MFNILSQESPWVLHEGFNPQVDFCIWLLEVDGLQVPPFNLHSGGDRSLQARGLTPALWSAWFRRVVLLGDQRLNWRIVNLQRHVEEQVTSHESVHSRLSAAHPELNLSEVSFSSIESGIKRFAQWQEQQYQQAAAAARQFCEESEVVERPASPVQLWNGNPSAEEYLKELWSQYQFIWAERRNYPKQRPEERPLTKPLTRPLWDALKPYHTRITALEIYRVSYPEPVEYPVQPVSVILTDKNGTSDSESCVSSVIHAVEELIVLNESAI